MMRDAPAASAGRPRILRRALRLNQIHDRIRPAAYAGLRSLDAKRYVEGHVREIIEPQAPLRREPAPDAPLASEALKGERSYENAEGWAWGELAADGYVGWLPANALAPPGAAVTHKVSALRTLAFPGPSIKLSPVEALPLGARLAITRIEGSLAVTPMGGHVPAAHLAPIDVYETDFVAPRLRRPTRPSAAARKRRVEAKKYRAGVKRLRRAEPTLD